MAIPSGNLLQFANLKMVIEIVDLPIENGGSFHSYVSLPEGMFFLLKEKLESFFSRKHRGLLAM